MGTDDLGIRLAGAVAGAVPGATELRHDLHRHPETAFHEERTTRVVAERLQALGLEVRTVPGCTGAVAEVRGAHPGPTVALRADLDALPIEEQTDVPYRSEKPGVMHACGHDGHTAILVGAATALASVRDALAGSVRLIFQPAEEPVSGARMLCDAGVLEDPQVTAIAALHGWPGLPLGTIDVSPGPVMASSDTFDVVVTGRGGHAAMPHLTVDPVVTAAHVVAVLQNIVSRMVPPTTPIVVSVTTVQAGGAYNIIPETARLKGTIRTLDADLRAQMPARLRRIVEGVCAAHGASAEVQTLPGCSVTVNDARVCAAVREAAEPMLGPERVCSEGEPSMGAEDFACYLERVPGAMIRLGIGDTPSVHNPRFDFPDATLPIGIELMVRVAVRLLQGLGS